MNNRELLEWCAEQSEGKDYIVFPEEVFDTITELQAKMVADHFGPTTMMKLPEYEIKFFEWLRENDLAVWNDLWAGDELFEPYIVAISFLPQLVANKSRGYPICDLLDNDNFYFTKQHMVDEESKVMIETAQKLFTERKPLTPTQLLALEISVDPIDIWHFAYKYDMSLINARKAVKTLVQDNALVHLTDAEHIAPFVDMKE